MIARIFAVLAASSVLLTASAAPAPGGNGVSQCNSGYVACCNSVQDAESFDKSHKGLLALIGVDVGSITGAIASNCSPINVLALGSGASW